jgi:hypothetical protein
VPREGGSGIDAAAGAVPPTAQARKSYALEDAAVKFIESWPALERLYSVMLMGIKALPTTSKGKDPTVSDVWRSISVRVHVPDPTEAEKLYNMIGA